MSAAKVVALTYVNAGIYDAAVASIAQDATWDFFCECGDLACDERTPLTLNRYEQLRDAGQAILAPGHHVDEKARARALRADARALRAQVQHQVRRASKNIDESGLRS